MSSGDVWRLGWVWTDANSGKPISSAISVQEGATPPTLGSGVDTAMEAMWTTLKPNYSPDLVLTKLYLRKVLPEDGSLYEKAESVAGTGADTPANAGGAVVTSFRTALAGRSYRGRGYWPMLRTGLLDGQGFISAANAKVYADAYETLDAALLATTYALAVIVLSRQHTFPGDSEPTVVVSKNRVTVYETDRLPRSQRKRQKRAPTYST